MKRNILFLSVFCFVIGIASLAFSLNPEEALNQEGEYHSICLHPAFSPDETKIAYFDSEKQNTTRDSWTNRLKIYDINNKSSRRIFETIFYDTPILWCTEIIDEFQQVKWSPNGQLLAISLDGTHVEIYDFKANKIVSKLTFKRHPEDEFLGYFYMAWQDNQSLILGYISKYAGTAETYDTYGLIKQEGKKFIIDQTVIPPDSPLGSKLYLSLKEDSEEKHAKGTPLLTLGNNHSIENVTYSAEEIENLYEIFYLPRPASNQWAVITVSETGQYAIVGQNNKDENPQTRLIHVDEKFKTRLIK